MADPNRALFELVFVGGCTTGLFITDTAAGGIRPTKDVDAIADVTSLDAFYGRGRGDIVASHDLEDIIAVVDGRPEIVSEVAAVSADVRDYIGAEIRALLENPDFVEALGGFLLPDAGSQGRRPLLEARLRALHSPRT